MNDPKRPDPNPDELIVISDAHVDVGVYGAPRAPIPVRLPVTPRFGGCASGAGVGVGADAAAGFRRLPDWLKVKLPGAGEYAETKALLRSRICTPCARRRAARTSATAGPAAPPRS